MAIHLAPRFSEDSAAFSIHVVCNQPSPQSPHALAHDNGNSMHVMASPNFLDRSMANPDRQISIQQHARLKQSWLPGFDPPKMEWENLKNIALCKKCCWVLAKFNIREGILRAL